MSAAQVEPEPRSRDVSSSDCRAAFHAGFEAGRSVGMFEPDLSPDDVHNVAVNQAAEYFATPDHRGAA